MTFQIDAQSLAMPVTATRETVEEAIALALDYRKRGFKRIEILDIETGAVYGEEFIVAYSAAQEKEKS
jgi:hypothetical protein